MKTAEHWNRTIKGEVRCLLCPHNCVIKEGAYGLCGVRQVHNASLVATSYGAIPAAHLDPMEKKPLYHFHPGEAIFSVGSYGCNLSCQFCQNWGLSRGTLPEFEPVSPSAVIETVRKSGAKAIAFTYNEPLVGFEFVYDCAALAKKSGFATVLVTNGFINSEPAEEILPLIDALNIDVKSMEDAFYKNICRGKLEPVLRFAEMCVQNGCHVEITNLVVTDANDSPNLFRELSGWIATELGESTPLHLSAYRPEYKMNNPATPLETLLKAYSFCKESLHYVYLGNIQSGEYQDTFCPECETLLVQRSNYRVKTTGIRNGKCSNCGRNADFVF
ncbi:MAG: AmmeMemoRadiSam system radical SAM enzyme [Lentisphaerae bacterium]|nr:AmmeMemoRadiSam system radical SAM enzyme [Lentisphaerota bacterium]